MRGRLPKIEFGLAAGEITKANREDAAQNVLLKSENADGYQESGAWGKIPGSTVISKNPSVAWNSVHYYEHYDLAGEFQRRVVGLSGTDFVEVDTTTGDRVTKKAGLTAEPLSAATTLDKLYVTSPSNDPFKYDGDSVTSWGVVPPGQQENILEAFDDHTNFSISGTNTKADATGVGSTDGSVQVNKVDTTVSTATLSRTGLSLNFGPAGVDLAYQTFFVPEGQLDALRQASFCVEIVLDDGSNENKYQFEVGELLEGENQLVLDLLNPDVDGSADLTAITDVSWTIYTYADSSVGADYRWDTFFIYDEGRLDAAVDSGGTGVSGAVTYRVTYVSKYGSESNAGPASASVSPSSQQVILSAIPVSPDPQVIARRIYRDLDGDALWQRLTTINDNSTTTYTDNTSFASLSTTTPPLTTDSANDRSRPRKMRQVVKWKNVLVGIDADNRFQINFSYENDPEAWPLTRQQQFDHEIVALIPHALGLMLGSTDRWKIMEGNTYSTFSFRDVTPNETVGISGWRAWAPAKRIAAVWADEGPFIQDGIDPWFIGSPIRDQIEDLDETQFRDVLTFHDRSRFRVLFFVPPSTCIVYGYGQAIGVLEATGAGIDPLDLRRGSVSKIVLPAELYPISGAVVERAGDLAELWLGTSDGTLYWMGDPSATDWEDGNGVAAESVDADIQTGWLSDPEGRAFRCRYLSVSAHADAKSTWTATVEAADQPGGEDGEDSSTDTFTFDIGPGATELEIPLVKGLWGEYARVRLQNSNLGEGGFFRKVALEVIPMRRRRAA